MANVWRIRMKYSPTNEDYSDRAWIRGEIGIWYGAWEAQDLEGALHNCETTEDIAAWLSNIPAQRELNWPEGVPRSYVATAVRLRDIPDDDWIFVYLARDQEIGLAKIRGSIKSSPDHPFNCDGELFKFREIHSKKNFHIDRLPDAFRLLGSQGRGNVHLFRTMHEHARLLAECNDDREINQHFRDRKFDELLDLLGASAWESFAVAFLVLENAFVPTGLSTGRTLPLADIVGRNMKTGALIVAQCKKNADPVEIDDAFLALAQGLRHEDSAFYFAYGGCTGSIPSNVRVVDRQAALAWAESEIGSRYRDLLLRN